ncbi:hypothetical protein FOZ62_024609 [Perkinsus olseni]|uniref:Uncharacterized protein n=2 Tax=Perkinsus olseni TaxID=32597 RepID=A0A7J6TN11_PEROL|nr:hypothetical protein FOZ62_024609 [Perkinsus olseni]
MDGSLVWNPFEQVDSFTLALLISVETGTGVGPVSWLLCLGGAGVLLLILLNLSPPLRLPPPAALIVFLLGLIVVIACHWSEIPVDEFGPSVSLVTITAQDWLDGILNGGLPQLPLTLLNSVISVCALARELFGDDCRGGSTKHMAVSVGAMNLLGCWFGAMPCCHGCGGLAAQYRFGARTGTSVVMLGLLKLIIGLIFGPQLLHILHVYPGAVLGPMLCIAAAELGVQALKATGNLSRELQDPSLASWLLFMTAAACVASGSTGWGFAIGYGLWIIVAGVRWLAHRCCGAGQVQREDLEEALSTNGQPCVEQKLSNLKEELRKQKELNLTLQTVDRKKAEEEQGRLQKAYDDLQAETVQMRLELEAFRKQQEAEEEAVAAGRGLNQTDSGALGMGELDETAELREALDAERERCQALESRLMEVQSHERSASSAVPSPHLDVEGLLPTTTLRDSTSSRDGKEVAAKEEAKAKKRKRKEGGEKKKEGKSKKKKHKHKETVEEKSPPGEIGDPIAGILPLLDRNDLVSASKLVVRFCYSCGTEDKIPLRNRLSLVLSECALHLTGRRGGDGVLSGLCCLVILATDEVQLLVRAVYSSALELAEPAPDACRLMIKALKECCRKLNLTAPLACMMWHQQCGPPRYPAAREAMLEGEAFECDFNAVIESAEPPSSKTLCLFHAALVGSSLTPEERYALIRKLAGKHGAQPEVKCRILAMMPAVGDSNLIRLAINEVLSWPDTRQGRRELLDFLQAHLSSMLVTNVNTTT